jgi:hypothetical protein
LLLNLAVAVAGTAVLDRHRQGTGAPNR